LIKGAVSCIVNRWFNCHLIRELHQAAAVQQPGMVAHDP
jgi:hypothetical protein